MKKIYCKNCRYYNCSDHFNYGREVCKAMTWETGDWLGKGIRHGECRMINYNNKCKLYKPKLWQRIKEFMVK